MDAAYTAFVNVLGYTSCVIPVTTADKTIDSADLGYAPTDDFDRKVYESCRMPCQHNPSCARSGLMLMSIPMLTLIRAR